MQMLLKRSDCHFMPQFVMIVFSVYKRIPKHLDQTNQKSAVQQVSLFEFNFAVIGLVYDYVNHSK